MDNIEDPLTRSVLGSSVVSEQEEAPRTYTAELAPGNGGKEGSLNGSGNNLRMRRSTVHSVSRSIASRLQHGVEADAQDGDSPEEEQNGSGTAAHKKPTFAGKVWKAVWEYLRPYYFLDHLDWKSLKPIIRTFVQFWVACLLIDISAVNQWLGNASYLVIIVCVILASGQMSIVIATIVPLCTLFAVIFSFALSVVCIAINARIRGFPTQQSVAEQLIYQGICKDDATISQCVEFQIFSGHFLTTRTTVITIIGYIVGQVFLYLMRIVNPVLLPASVVGTIMLLLLLFYGNLVPFFKPMLIGNLVLRPFGLGVSLVFVTALLIFPASSSGLYLNACSSLTGSLAKLSKQNVEILGKKKPTTEEFAIYKELGVETTKMRTVLSKLEVFAKTIGFEVSVGRVDAGDVGELQSILASVFPVLGSFQLYYGAIEERKQLIKNNLQPIRRVSTAAPAVGTNMSVTSKIFTSLQDTYKAVGEFENRFKYDKLKRILSEKNPEDIMTLEDLDALQEIIHNRYKDVLNCASDALLIMAGWMADINDFRFFSYLIPGNYQKCKKKQQVRAQEIIEIQKALEAQLTNAQEASWDDLCAARFEHNDMLLAVVTLGVVFGYITDWYVRGVLRLLALAVEVDTRRPTPAVITPFTKLIRKKAQFPDDGMSRSDMPQDSFSLKKEIDQRDPDASPPKNVGHLIGRRVLSIFELFYNQHLTFALKLATVVVMSAAPLFVRTTAEWYFKNRLIWIPVMISLPASEFAGDTVYNFLTRVFGTFVSCLIALVAWYISAGNGVGNVWGFGVVTAVIAFFSAFYRLYSVHQIVAPAILIPVTIFLVLGTSWQDGRPGQFTDLGHGFHVVWVRFVTVLLGVVISFIPAVLPRPQTARAAVRKIIARVLEESGNIHGNVIKFAIERSYTPSVRIAPRHDIITLNFRTLFRKLAYNMFLFPTMSYEPSLKGVWPKHKYERLQRLTTELVQFYFSFYNLIDQFQDPSTHVPLLLARCGYTNPALQADLFSVLYMGSSALASSRPLPMVTPAHTSILHSGYIHERWGITGSSFQDRFFFQRDSDGDEEDGEVGTETDFLYDWKGHLDMRRLLSHDGRLIVVGIYIAHLIYERLDEIMYVIKGLVGEEFEVDLKLFKELEDIEYETIKKMS